MAEFKTQAGNMGLPGSSRLHRMMRSEGFNSVIAYNWVAQSSTAGTAIKQSPRLARMILDVASNFPAGDPVNLEFIGHSEGTVINTYAIVNLESKMTPELKSGYIEDTLLDPHAANNNRPGSANEFWRRTRRDWPEPLSPTTKRGQRSPGVCSLHCRSGPGFLRAFSGHGRGDL